MPNFLHKPSRRRISRNFTLRNMSITGLRYCLLDEIPDKIGVSRNWHIEKSPDKIVWLAYKISFMEIEKDITVAFRLRDTSDQGAELNHVVI